MRSIAVACLTVVLVVLGLGAPGGNAARVREITVAVPNDLVSLDPSAHSDQVTDEIMTGAVYEMLDRQGNPMGYEPQVAQSWRIVNDTTWEFTIRPGIRFHNGEPVTAEVVKYSLDRCLEPANKCPRRGHLAIISKVEVVNSSTVRLQTEQPYASLPSGLELGFIEPMKALQADPQALQKRAIGTGPMRFVEWDRGQRLVLERNPDYWGKPAAFDRVIYRPIPDEIARVAALQAGEVQLATAIPPEMVPVLTRNPKTAVDRRGLREVYIGLDSRGRNEKPTADVRVRQAMNLAVNKDVLITKILQGNAIYDVGGMFPTMPGFDPGLKPYAYDPAKAKQLLAEAGYPNGFDITLTYVPGIEGSLKTTEVMESVASDLGKIGIRVHLVTSEVGAFWSAYHAAKLQMYVATWGTAPESGLSYRTLLHSKTRGYYYQNAKTDELLNAYFAALDAHKRTIVGRELQRYIYDQAPFLFLFNQLNLYGMSSHVTWGPRPSDIMWVTDMGWKE